MFLEAFLAQSASSKGIEVVEGVTVPQVERAGVFEGFKVAHLVLDGFNGPHLWEFCVG